MVVSYPLVANGWDLSSMMGEGMTMNGAVTSTILYGRYDANWIIGYILLSIVCAVLSALYPAWKVQQLTPVDAMRS
jgi:ABC-type antimicrobial peptide transport system permease subunit